MAEASTRQQFLHVINQEPLNSVQAVVSIAQSVVTMLAFVVGGAWGYRLFRLKRQKFPRAVIEHQIDTRVISGHKALVRLVVTFSNKGDVLIPLRSGEARIQQLLPLPEKLPELIDKDKDEIKARHLIERFRELIPSNDRYLWQTEIPWPEIDSYQTTWKKGWQEVEPGDSIQLRYDFLLDRSVRTVIIYSFFLDVAKRPPLLMFWKKARVKLGWDWVTIHDLKISHQGERKGSSHNSITGIEIKGARAGGDGARKNRSSVRRTAR